MKKKAMIFTTLALVIGLIGCTEQASPSSEDGAEAQSRAGAPNESWSYRLSTETSEVSYQADDGTVVAIVSCEQPLLTLVNENGEPFAGDTPERGVTAEQLAVCKTFNEATAYQADTPWAEDEKIDWAELGRENYEWRKEFEEDVWPPIYYERTVEGSNQFGNLLSVWVGESCYTGGAHPNNGMRSWNYDLANGTFVALSSLTDRPEELRRVLVDEIAAQINASEEREGYFEDWYDTLAQTTDFDVFFEEGSMTVFFSEYTLGPHALGIPIFEIAYDTFAEFLNDYGRQLLPLS